jgi:flagellar biosynthesis anti-sigma factor FlgM
MKITDNSSPPIQLDAYIKQTQQQTRTADITASPGAAGQNPKDKVNLSDEARAVLQSSQFADGQPDIRDEKVNQVKMEIEKGTYRVDGSRVAANMLKEGFENDLLLQKINTQA